MKIQAGGKGLFVDAIDTQAFGLSGTLLADVLPIAAALSRVV